MLPLERQTSHIDLNEVLSMAYRCGVFLVFTITLARRLLLIGRGHCERLRHLETFVIAWTPFLFFVFTGLFVVALESMAIDVSILRI